MRSLIICGLAELVTIEPPPAPATS
jgi:hypothetical protein